MDKKIRVRFAPSPTGFVHMGSLRTTLYDYLFARKNGGTFILRVEDTDQKRFMPGAVENLIRTLEWANLHHDEGVFLENGKIIQKGEYGPYFQSERLDIYKKYANQLLDTGVGYRCFCTTERLEKMREVQIASKRAPMYDRACLKLSAEEIAEKLKNGESCVIRQKINTEGFTEFEDIVRGKVKFENSLLDDQIIMKSDGFPTYNFANVIDDHLMEITHAIRGEEFVSSTPKYIQLYQAFGWSAPEFAHLPLLLNPDKSKLSKRQGDVAVEDYMKKGYLKEALINFVALLGWNPGDGNTQEIFSLEELVQKFDLARVHKAGAVFDLKKLDWLNAQYIKKLSIAELYEKSLEFFAQKDFYKSWIVERGSWSAEEKEKYLKKVLQIEQERLNNLSEVGEKNQFFFMDISYDKNLLRWKDMSDIALQESLEKSIAVLTAINENDWEIKNIEERLFAVAGDKKGDLLWPLRVALSGAQKSPSPMELAWLLGKTESLKRLEKAKFVG